MTPRYHPSDERLLEQVTGSLDLGRREVIAAHLRACAACRAKVAVGAAIGGALLSDLPPALMRSDALDHALAQIERPEPAAPPPPRVARPDWLVGASPLVAAAWRGRRWAAPGVWVASVDRPRSGGRTYLLRVGAGMSVPRHCHRGTEMVCVLKGAYIDGAVTHRVGDYAENDEAVDHTPRVTPDDECVCLISADGALVARDWVGRVFQPIVGI